jgi:uncharacterized protein YbaP (TraB family)
MPRHTARVSRHEISMNPHTTTPAAGMLLLALLLPLQCAAQATTFDAATGVVDIPCVYAADLSQPQSYLYKARLRRIGSSSQFSLEQLQSTDYDTDCSGWFHLGTKVYSDRINVGDSSYNVRMRRGADNLFTLETATLRGPATTSLWVARHGSNTVYLAGAMHLLSDADHPLPRAYDEAYEKASALYFEVDEDDPHENGANLTQAQLSELARDPQGRTLSQLLSPVTYGLLRDYLANTWKTEIASVEHWSAQMVAAMYGSWHLQAVHGVAAHGVDDYLVGRALADHKPVAGLETVASQYAVLQTMDEGIEEQVVDSFLFSILSGGDILGFEELVRIWRRGDTTELARRLKLKSVNDTADYRLLYANRNNAWVPQIEALLRTPQTEMVVVGVMHMAGPDGLIAQLRRRGYQVEKY